MNKSVYLLAATALLVACSAKTPNAVDAPTAAEPGPLAAPQFASLTGDLSINPERLVDIVKVLASDEFEGRAPGTAGEDKTVAYLAEAFTELGLEPAGTEGWVQQVPMMRTKIQHADMAFAVAGNSNGKTPIPTRLVR